MDTEIIIFISDKKFMILLGFFILEKAVKLSPSKMDDILVDGLKDIFKRLWKKPA